MKRYIRLVKPVVAEGLGTYVIALAIGMTFLATQVSSLYQALFVPSAIGLALAVMYYLLGPVSGGHFNPGITLAMFTTRRTGLVRTILYLLFQVLGAVLAALSVKYFFGIAPYKPDYVNVQTGFFAELMGAVILGLAYGAAVRDEIPEAARGLVLGLAYMLAITLSAVVSSGIVNPAVALVWRGNGMVYGVAPLAGALVGVWLMAWLYPKKMTEASE